MHRIYITLNGQDKEIARWFDTREKEHIRSGFKQTMRQYTVLQITFEHRVNLGRIVSAMAALGLIQIFIHPRFGSSGSPYSATFFGSCEILIKLYHKVRVIENISLM